MANIVDTDALNQYDQETSTFTSGDSSSPNAWQSVSVLASGETKPSIFAKISKMFANIRWLYNNKRTTGAFDSKSDTVTFTSEDSSYPSGLKNVNLFASGLTHATLLNYISAMMNNLRYMQNTCGVGSFTTTDLEVVRSFPTGVTNTNVTFTKTWVSYPTARNLTKMLSLDLQCEGSTSVVKTYTIYLYADAAPENMLQVVAVNDDGDYGILEYRPTASLGQQERLTLRVSKVSQSSTSKRVRLSFFYL